MEHVSDANPSAYIVIPLNAFNVLPITLFNLPLLYASLKPSFLPNFMAACLSRNRAQFISAICAIKLKTYGLDLTQRLHMHERALLG